MTKGNRKGRKPRLGFALIREPDPTFEPDEAQWKDLETYLGKELDQETHSEISAIVNHYLLSYRGETAAPLHHDTVGWLRSLEALSAEVQSWLLKDRVPGSGPDYAYSVLKQKLEFLSGSKLEPMIWIMAFNKSCGQAIEQLSSQTGFQEGNAWASFIVRLTKLAEEKGWPTGVSKGSKKWRTGRQSAFTIFIDSIQRMLPSDARRHSQSLDSLAQGITLARKAARDAKEKS